MTPAPEITQEAAQALLKTLKGILMIEGWAPSHPLYRAAEVAIALAEGRAP